MESVVNDNYDGTEKVPLNDADAANIEMNELDDSKAQFIKNDEAEADPTSVKIKLSDDKEFTGLTKEELMEYANSPFWTKLRLALFILFWVGWIAMLAAAIIIIVLAPRCPFRPDHKWWQSEAVYQVYPQSFQDSTKGDNDEPNARFDDGYGDLKGFDSRIGYLEELATNVVWLNSIYASDKYGVTNHTDVCKKSGTVGELKKIIKKMHKKGMKLVLDFIPNFTSKNHTWFQKSAKSDAKYKDYYVWLDCDKAPKATWRDILGNEAWTEDTTRNQCYYHSGLANQPDLNLKNSEVQAELKAVLEYWSKLGVDGFHVNDVENLVEGEVKDKNADASLMKNQPMNAELLQDWNEVISAFSKPGREKLLFTTLMSDANTTLMYMGTLERPGAHFIPSQVLYNLPRKCNATCILQRVYSVVNDMSTNHNVSYGWRLNDQDNQRLASMVDNKYINAIHTVQMLLPGTSVSYYGDEIGLKDAPISSFADVQDPVGLDAGKNGYKSKGRDQFRTPMRWDDSKTAGFTKGTPYLPLTGVDQPNVQEHKAMFAVKSPIDFYKMLTKMRKNEAFRWGETKWSVNDDNLLSFVRIAEGFDAYLVAVNLGASTANPKFTDNPAGVFSDKMEVVLHSARGDISEDKPEELNPNKLAVVIKPGEALVFKFTPAAKE